MYYTYEYLIKYMVCKYFLPVCGWSFHILDIMTFETCKFLVLMNSSFVLFFVCIVLYKKTVLNQRLQALFLWFFFKSFIPLRPIFVFDPFWVTFYVWCEVGTQHYSSTCEPSCTVEKTFLFPLIVLACSHVKSINYICESMFLDSQFYSIDLYMSSLITYL